MLELSLKICIPISVSSRDEFISDIVPTLEQLRKIGLSIYKSADSSSPVKCFDPNTRELNQIFISDNLSEDSLSQADLDAIYDYFERFFAQSDQDPPLDLPNAIPDVDINLAINVNISCDPEKPDDLDMLIGFLKARRLTVEDFQAAVSDKDINPDTVLKIVSELASEVG